MPGLFYNAGSCSLINNSIGSYLDKNKKTPNLMSNRIAILIVYYLGLYLSEKHDHFLIIVILIIFLR